MQLITTLVSLLLTFTLLAQAPAPATTSQAAPSPQDEQPAPPPHSKVIPPVVQFAPQPEFSEQARKKKVSGNILVALVVDTNGNATQVHVKRGVGYGLDEKAVEAVLQYRFKPATKDGVPVPYPMAVEVNFQFF